MAILHYPMKTPVIRIDPPLSGSSETPSLHKPNNTKGNRCGGAYFDTARTVEGGGGETWGRGIGGQRFPFGHSLFYFYISLSGLELVEPRGRSLLRPGWVVVVVAGVLEWVRCWFL